MLFPLWTLSSFNIQENDLGNRSTRTFKVSRLRKPRLLARLNFTEITDCVSTYQRTGIIEVCFCLFWQSLVRFRRKERIMLEQILVIVSIHNNHPNNWICGLTLYILINPLYTNRSLWPTGSSLARTDLSPFAGAHWDWTAVPLPFLLNCIMRSLLAWLGALHLENVD